jgi:hypothetical protein
VEQITTALVYKFVDDMDKESQEFGGEAKFFTNRPARVAQAGLPARINPFGRARLRQPDKSVLAGTGRSVGRD